MDPVDRARPRVDIDIGGTWFRARVTHPGTAPRPVVHPAPSRLRDAARPAGELIEALLDLVDTTAPPGADVAISLGAAMDETTGVVHGSGPLWGDWTGPLPFAELLRARRGDARWHVYNDLTCGVAAFAAQAPAWSDQVTYVTVSSGVALRTADRERGVIDVDAWGMQGEIGHADAVPREPGLYRAGPLPCDCGGCGHVASLASGPGMARAAEILGLGPAAGFAERFAGLLDDGDPRARTLLTEAVRPVAEQIRALWRLRPHAELVGVGGGVAVGLGRRYEAELRRLLAADRAYSDAGRDEAWVAARVRVLAAHECDLLTGARLLAEGFLRARPPAHGAEGVAGPPGGIDSGLSGARLPGVVPRGVTGTGTPGVVPGGVTGAGTTGIRVPGIAVTDIGVPDIGVPDIGVSGIDVSGIRVPGIEGAPIP